MPVQLLISHPPAPAQRHAFSLVELVMALGIVAFALLSLLALLPIGLGIMQETSSQSAEASIERSIRGDLNQTTFKDLDNLAQKNPFFFDAAGLPLSDDAPERERCFRVTFTGTSSALADKLPGPADDFERSARLVNFTISYLNANSRAPRTFAIWVANQGKL